MVWGTHRCTITLTANGDYTCQWFSQTYVGSWRLDHAGQFWITESNSPDNPHAWRSYAVALDPATGKTLWKTDVGGPMSNAPITYEWAGRQYVIIGARNTLTALALPTGG